MTIHEFGARGEAAGAHPNVVEPPWLDDDQFAALRATAASYTAIILTTGPNRDAPDAAAIIFEHGRRMAALHLQGHLPIVCPVPDDTDVRGIGIFTTTVEETAVIMAADPAVRAGIFRCEVHPVRSFPGSTLRPSPPGS